MTEQLQPPLTSSVLPPPPNQNPKISPSILLIIIILALIFFLAGILQLLIRFLFLTPQNQRHLDDQDPDSVTVLQGQLQQLFQLHDGGVDQSQIDTLPVFHYKSIIGLKDPFDCAVCLSEFEPEDNLRLLPNCSHAFHMDCIDTWLLCHSTCPLCRSGLLDGFAPVESVPESGRVSGSGLENVETGVKTEKEKIMSVKLGKFRNLESAESSEINAFEENHELGTRRCFSMGSFAYILDEKTSLQVPIRKTAMKKQSMGKKKQSFPWRREVMSEYGYGSNRTIHEKNEKISFSSSSIGENEEETQSCYSFDSMANSNNNSNSRRTLLWLMGRHTKIGHNHSSSISSIV